MPDGVPMSGTHEIYIDHANNQPCSVRRTFMDPGIGDRAFEALRLIAA